MACAEGPGKKNLKVKSRFSQKSGLQNLSGVFIPVGGGPQVIEWFLKVESEPPPSPGTAKLWYEPNHTFGKGSHFIGPAFLFASHLCSSTLEPL